jgi:hypothetical protein
MKRRWLVPVTAAVVLLAAVVGGAYLLTSDNTDETPSDTPSQGSVSPQPTATSTDAGTTDRAVPVYFVGDTPHGQRLFREFQQQQVCAGAECLMKASAESAVSGAPVDGDYTAPWPDGTGLEGATYNGDVLTLDLTGDLHDRPSGMSEDEAGLAVQQLIYSAQAGLGKGRVPVQLLLDGKHTDTVLGVPASEPLAAGKPDDVQAPVQVDSPADGATVDGTFTVTGRAATFEANVVWELKRGDEVVKGGFTTARECCTLAPYSFEVTAPAGTYTLVVHDTDESGEGRPVNEDTKQITVR